ncbi:transcriptional regulator [Escherichia coli]|uniref:helix-turn-helix transcriptional regulator n=1 Tax=Escherichia coli TaxID=562 RepID=UPI000DAD8BF1|nr:helix-turn-helix transcriptional regulator [Escherichia coli]EES1934954.1 transcriptional regulator [Escherichia coli]PZZ87025.1 transcriptional regulator [Escherichia coli]
MSGLTPQEMVKSLIDSGYTQNQIAEITGVKQSSISRLRTGVHSDPRFSTVRAIEKLFQEVTARQKA